MRAIDNCELVCGAGGELDWALYGECVGEKLKEYEEFEERFAGALVEGAG